MPHAPLLLEELSSPEVATAAQAVRNAYAELVLPDGATVVVTSPHGETTGVYERVEGDLSAFGVTDVGGDFEIDREAVDLLTRASGLPSIAGPVDHGVLVPLLLGVARGHPVIGVTFAENASRDELLAQSKHVEEAVISIAETRDVFLIASVNTAAALSPRAPYTERTEAVDAERRVLERLDGTVTLEADAIERLCNEGRSCSYAPLSIWAHLFAGRRTRRLAYETPVGVGYLVLRTETDGNLYR